MATAEGTRAGHFLLTRLQRAHCVLHPGLGYNPLVAESRVSFVIWDSAPLPEYGGVSWHRMEETELVERMILAQFGSQSDGVPILPLWAPASFSYCLGSSGNQLASSTAVLIPHPCGQGCLWMVWLSDYPGLLAFQMSCGTRVLTEGFRVPFYMEILVGTEALHM